MRVCFERTFFQIQQKQKKGKERVLAHAIAQSTDRITTLGEVVHNTMPEKDSEEPGELEHGEINLLAQNQTAPYLAVRSTASNQASTITNFNRGRGRGSRPF